MTEVNDFIGGDDPFGTMGDELESITAEDLSGATVVVNGFRVLKSTLSEGNYAAMDLTVGDIGEGRLWSTSSRVIMSQLDSNKENLPFRASVAKRISKKNGKEYLTFEGV